MNLVLQEGKKFEPPDENEWIKIAEERAKEDPAIHYNMFISDSVPDFAKFWATSVVYLHNNSKILN